MIFLPRFAISLLFAASAAFASAGGVNVDMGSCSGPPKFTSPNTFFIPPGAGGNSIECFISSMPIFSLDIDFAAPPVPADISCVSPFFAICVASESGGFTDVHLESGTGPGIQSSEIFDISLTGFNDGQEITETANTPEPGTLIPVLLAMIAGAVAFRRREPMPARPASDV